MKRFGNYLNEGKEWVLWGLPRGKRDHIDAQILYTQAKNEADIERVKALAKKDGWHSFRVQVLDLSKPFNASAAFGKAVREGVEHGNTPQPKPEYFQKPFNISGKIVQLYPVFDIPVKTKKYIRIRDSIGDREGFSPYVDSPGQKAYDIKMSVWRWRVRIQTDEGWMLMGYIGTSDRKEGLPPIRMGDTVEVTGIKLSRMTGGNQITRASSWVKGGYTMSSDKPVDYRSDIFSRQLHGKVKRKAV